MRTSVFAGSRAAGKKKIDGRNAMKAELTEIGKQSCFFNNINSYTFYLKEDI